MAKNLRTTVCMPGDCGVYYSLSVIQLAGGSLLFRSLPIHVDISIRWIILKESTCFQYLHLTRIHHHSSPGF